MCTWANSDDPDEMPYSAAFHQGLHCLLGKNPKYNFFGNLTCDHTDFIVCRFMKNFKEGNIIKGFTFSCRNLLLALYILIIRKLGPRL